MKKLVRRLQVRLRTLETQNEELRQACENNADNGAGLMHLVKLSTSQVAADSARIQRITRFANAIDEIGYAVSCSQTLERMYREVCRACVESGGFSLAWLGVVDPDTQCISPLEVAGTAEPYLDAIISRNGLDVPAGREPSAIAFREKRLYVCNDIAALPLSEPWHERATRFGLFSALALPLFRGGKLYATLTAYGPERNFIDAEMVRLFENMTDCMSLAIDEFDREEQQRLDGEKLRQSEEKFRTLVENLPLKIFVKDARANYVSCNELFARDLGISPEQIAGRSDFDFFSPSQAEQFRREDQMIIETGNGMDLHESNLQDGVEKIVHVIKTPFKNAEGKIVGVLGAIWDITERKQAELKLRQFAYEVEDIYQNAPCGYHSIDADGAFIRINHTELEWLGYKREEVVGRLRLPDLLTDSSRQIFFETFPEFKRSGSIQDLEIEMVRKDGTLLPVMLSATAVYDDDGNYESSRTMVSDVSVRKELEREHLKQGWRLEELSHRLVAVQEEERRRLAGELHDRANPNLVAIQLMLSNLTSSLPEEFLDRNRESLDDIRALLDDTTASIREICTELRPPLLDYSGLVPTLEAYAQQIARRIGVAVSVEARMDGSRLGRNVESLLFRIVQEAVANCAKHSFAKHIHIKLASATQNTILTIKDDGVGFRPETLGEGGAAPGLGIITMKERAEFAGGSLSITSHPGGGTEIKVAFDTVERRASLSRRQQDISPSSRASLAGESAAAAIRQLPTGSTERRAGLCRRRQEGDGSGAHSSSSDTAQARAGAGLIDRRVCASRRQQDLASSLGGLDGLDPSDLATQFRFS